MVSVNCRARIKQQRKEGLLSAFLMMLSNIVVKQRSGRKFSRHSFVVLSHCFHWCIYHVYWWCSYYDTFLPFLLEACNDENPDVRQVSPCLPWFSLCFLTMMGVWLIRWLVVSRQLFMVLVSVRSLGDLFLSLLSEVANLLNCALVLFLNYSLRNMHWWVHVFKFRGSFKVKCCCKPP